MRFLRKLWEAMLPTAKPSWISTADRMPEPGQPVVKYWKETGNVWAGKHIPHAKHESFDEWLPLPPNQ